MPFPSKNQPRGRWTWTRSGWFRVEMFRRTIEMLLGWDMLWWLKNEICVMRYIWDLCWDMLYWVEICYMVEIFRRKNLSYKMPLVGGSGLRCSGFGAWRLIATARYDQVNTKHSPVNNLPRQYIYLYAVSIFIHIYVYIFVYIIEHIYVYARLQVYTQIN